MNKRLHHSCNRMPKILEKRLTLNATQRFQPAWLQLTKGGADILMVGGAWQHYFDVSPDLGTDASEAYEVLMGMLPLEDDFELPQIQLVDGKYTDVIALCGNDSDWLLFCDVSAETEQFQKYQQIANDLLLLQGQHQRTLNRYVGSEVVRRDAEGDLSINAKAERRVISTLFTDIRGFTPFNESHDAQVVIETLNEYMTCMLDPILNQAGMIDKITGDGAMAVFGILDSEHGCIDDAFVAGKQILKAVQTLNEQRQKQGLEQLGVGVGIASGEAVLGMLGTHHRRCFTAIGPHVNRAARLESNAPAGDILLDGDSYLALQQPIDCVPMTLNLKGIGDTCVYVWHLDILPALKNEDSLRR